MPALQGKVIEALAATDLLKRHESVFEEDFAKGTAAESPGSIRAKNGTRDVPRPPTQAACHPNPNQHLS